MESKKLPPQNKFVGDDDMRFYGVIVSFQCERRLLNFCGGGGLDFAVILKEK